jgi:hypothetical protein
MSYSNTVWRAGKSLIAPHGRYVQSTIFARGGIVFSHPFFVGSSHASREANPDRCFGRGDNTGPQTQRFAHCGRAKLQNQCTQFQQIGPGTYFPLDVCEAGLPHHYFTPEELHNLFKQLLVMDLHLDRDQRYCITAVKR